jgi:hypothetical protein
MTEEFKIVDGYNYSVSNLSRVRNNETGKFLKACKDGRGYLQVQLSKNKIPKMFSIHRLIGIYFIENVNNYEMMDHINRNRLDNRVENLRWVSSSQNQANKGKKQNTSSTFIGVYFNKASNKWLSRIQINKKRKYLGLFNTEIEASEFRKKYILDNQLTEFYN